MNMVGSDILDLNKVLFSLTDITPGPFKHHTKEGYKVISSLHFLLDSDY